MNCTTNSDDTSFTSCNTAMSADRPEHLAWTDALNPMQGQITYLTVAAIIAVRAGLSHFRYNAEKDHYKMWKAVSSGTNWFKWANDVQDWTALVIGSIAFISQLFSMFGMLNSMNVMIWMYGVHMSGIFFTAFSSALRFLAMDMAWKKAQGDTSKDFDVYDAIKYYPVIRASFT